MVAGRAIELVRSRRRTLELRVFPDGKVQVRAPLRARQRDIEDFVHAREDWLGTTLRRMAERPLPRQPAYQDGERHLLLGRRLPLRVTAAARNRVSLGDAGIQVACKGVSADTVARLLERFYRAQARVLFEQLVDQHYPFFAERGHARPRLAIKRMRTRWGSLSSRGGMSLNLELVKVPLPLVEYVVVHELCHLEHANHGPGFKALMTDLMPDWRERKQALEAAPLC